MPKTLHDKEGQQITVGNSNLTDFGTMTDADKEQLYHACRTAYNLGRAGVPVA